MTKYNSIIKELKVPKDKINNFGNYKYRDAATILETVKPLLEEYNCELYCDETIEEIGGRFYVKIDYSLFDMEGEDSHALASSQGYAREQDKKSGMDDAQITGAATSYAKKYALCNLFHIDDSRLDPDTELMARLQEQQEKEQKGKKTATPQQTTQTTKVDKEKTVYTEDTLWFMLDTIEAMEDVKTFLTTNKIDLNRFPETRAKLNAKFSKK